MSAIRADSGGACMLTSQPFQVGRLYALVVATVQIETIQAALSSAGQLLHDRIDDLLINLLLAHARSVAHPRCYPFARGFAPLPSRPRVSLVLPNFQPGFPGFPHLHLGHAHLPRLPHERQGGAAQGGTMTTGLASRAAGGLSWPQRRGRAIALMQLHRKLLGVLVALAAVGALAMAAPPRASAATEAGYPTALVEFQASTRTQPYVNQSTYSGFALREPSGGRQTVSVGCWWDGSWAVGNYGTSRWFKVKVWESYDGYATPRWLFVHASYVYNQPGVPRCTQYQTGIY